MSLPSGYTRLEYIQSTGTQYVDSGFIPNGETSVEIAFESAVIDPTTSGYYPVYGAASNYNSNAFELWSLAYGFCTYGSQPYKSGFGLSANVKYISKQTKNVLEINNQTLTFTKQTFSAPYNLLIFATHRSDGIKISASDAKLKVYYLKIYDDGTLVRYFIPCQKPDGTVGLWDDVNSVFYGNAGTGTFTAGPVYVGTHKTLVNGTVYEVQGGKCLVNGTAYSIKKGRTLIGGTGYDITFAPTYDPVFANNTWEQIIEACHNNEVPDTWKVADHKPMTINGASYQVDIIGKNHDTYANGGKAPLTFQLHDCYGETKNMNSSNTNSGGWTSCAMRSTHLPAILALMPTEVQNGIREVNKMTSAGSLSATINTTADKLFLLSEIEIFGSVSHSKSGEGTQYDYYKAGNSKVKKFNGRAIYWWERSPRGSQPTYFCSVDSYGAAVYTGASIARGVAFGFCF